MMIEAKEGEAKEGEAKEGEAKEGEQLRGPQKEAGFEELRIVEPASHEHNQLLEAGWKVLHEEIVSIRFYAKETRTTLRRMLVMGKRELRRVS